MFHQTEFVLEIFASQEYLTTARKLIVAKNSLTRLQMISNTFQFIGDVSGFIRFQQTWSGQNHSILGAHLWNQTPNPPSKEVYVFPSNIGMSKKIVVTHLRR
ncbi:hypothetical protein BUALT_Bualt15G0124900 [Buddleja alternifolia]|uniref:Uncharacterized protein n=1 Tax=Buddleja alternifolia TaxID=168488 RepID=A0AAV6WJW9_9LAMI|nr:hypothetical protein BUALT_Bualt15G0124900 [Buddleja alternifolia]